MTASGNSKKARLKAATAQRRPRYMGGDPEKIKEDAQRAATRRQAALDNFSELQSFFRHAGVRTVLARSDEVRVSGSRVCALLKLGEVRDWNLFLNRVAAAYCSKQFASSLRRNLTAAGAVAFYDRELHGFRIEKDGRDLAAVWATSAAVWGEGEPRQANFLADGPHWEEFRQRFDRAWKRPPEPETEGPKSRPITSERPRTPPPPPMTLILGVPDGVSFDLAEAALEASRRIREERQLVFDHELILHYRDGDLKLRPLRGSANDLRAPFSYTRINGVRNVRGVISLSGSGDPLAIRLDTDSAGPLTGVIWACALLGFASVTCIEIAHPSPRIKRSGAGGSRGSRAPPSGDSRVRSAPHVRHSIWPQELRPVGRWAAQTASYVAGHIRQLYDGRSASTEARERARAVGLVLGPGETYVRPHARGLPDHGVLEFDWHCDEALLLYRDEL